MHRDINSGDEVAAANALTATAGRETLENVAVLSSAEYSKSSCERETANRRSMAAAMGFSHSAGT